MLKNNKTLIGIAGNSRCGKDTLYSVLKNIYKLDIDRISVGDIIKNDLRHVIGNLGLNPNTEILSEKDVIRPLLAEYGVLARKSSKAKYFLDKLDREMYICKSKFVAVTDVRFAEYEYDELNFIKNNGILVYLERERTVDGQKTIIGPANKYEAENNPKLKNAADIIVKWPTAIGEIDIYNLSELSIYCSDLVEKIKDT